VEPIDVLPGQRVSEERLEPYVHRFHSKETCRWLLHSSDMESRRLERIRDRIRDGIARSSRLSLGSEEESSHGSTPRGGYAIRQA